MAMLSMDHVHQISSRGEAHARRKTEGRHLPTMQQQKLPTPK
jgi:hypothetical protein